MRPSGVSVRDEGVAVRWGRKWGGVRAGLGAVSSHDSQNITCTATLDSLAEDRCRFSRAEDRCRFSRARRFSRAPAQPGWWSPAGLGWLSRWSSTATSNPSTRLSTSRSSARNEAVSDGSDVGPRELGYTFVDVVDEVAPAHGYTSRVRTLGRSPSAHARCVRPVASQGRKIAVLVGQAGRTQPAPTRLLTRRSRAPTRFEAGVRVLTVRALTASAQHFAATSRPVDAGHLARLARHTNVLRFACARGAAFAWPSDAHAGRRSNAGVAVGSAVAPTHGSEVAPAGRRDRLTSAAAVVGSAPRVEEAVGSGRAGRGSSGPARGAAALADGCDHHVGSLRGAWVWVGSAVTSADGVIAPTTPERHRLTLAKAAAGRRVAEGLGTTRDAGRAAARSRARVVWASAGRSLRHTRVTPAGEAAHLSLGATGGATLGAGVPRVAAHRTEQQTGQ